MSGDSRDLDLEGSGAPFGWEGTGGGNELDSSEEVAMASSTASTWSTGSTIYSAWALGRAGEAAQTAEIAANSGALSAASSSPSPVLELVTKTKALLQILRNDHLKEGMRGFFAAAERGDEDALVNGVKALRERLDVITNRLHALNGDAVGRAEDHDDGRPGLNELLQPGAVFQGTIKIPVPEQEESGGFGQRVPYSLRVERSFKDEFGGEAILIEHSAHEDEQMCVLTTSGQRIAFNDYETICKGSAFPEQKSLRGVVKQLQYGMEGFALEGRESVHTFELELNRIAKGELQEAREAAVRVRNLYAFAIAFCYAYKSPSLYVLGTFEAIKSHVNLELCNSCFRLLSELNAMMLRQANALDKITFQDEREKVRMLEHLRNEGVDRAKIHSACDALMLLSFPIMYPVIRREDQQEAANQMCLNQRRLRLRANLCFDRFDKALRSAETRVPLIKILAQCVEPGNFKNETCCICLDPLSEEPEAHFDSEEIMFTNSAASAGGTPLPPNATMRTSCGHSFHFHCAKTWFHRHNTCPHCRSSIEL